MAQIAVAVAQTGHQGDFGESSRRAALTATFEQFRTSLDASNERRERLIVTSRQITALSKKLIFHLHRGAVGTDAEGHSRLVSEGKKKEQIINDLFVNVRDELKGGSEGSEEESFWRYARQVSPGLEEYIEALSFLHFIEHGSLITLAEVQSQLTDHSSGQKLLFVTSEDYILGISDLTGELMRYATNAIGTGDHETPLRVCAMVREIKAVFDVIPPYILRKLEQKQAETQRSLEKIEKICYALRLRLIEFADRPDVLAQIARRALEEAETSSEQRPQEVTSGREE